MITREEALKKLEGDVYEITPTDKERICIPVHGFVGAKEEEYNSWEGPKKAKGYKFVNETDSTEQLAAVDGGVIMCYEGKTPDGKRMRSEVVKEYLENHPLAAKTANGVKDLVDFLSTIAIGSEGKPDVYTTDLGFVSKKILGAPAKEDIKPGEMIVGQKVAGTLKAYKVAKGVEYEGAPGTVSAQVAGENGAWIIASNEGHPRMIQDGEFKQAYRITKAPEAKAKSNARDM